MRDMRAIPQLPGSEFLCSREGFLEAARMEEMVVRLCFRSRMSSRADGCEPLGPFPAESCSASVHSPRISHISRSDSLERILQAAS